MPSEPKKIADRDTSLRSLELWGGIECTVNRVGDLYRDQTVLSGHHDRTSDLDLFAELGLRALRYPVLWERTESDASRLPNWTWPDERLGRLRSLGIRPIIGLVHHGSGPRHTNLLDESFAPGLERYAGLVAARYPWVEEWTPVNEPLTTSRFSALYGHWYPHHRDERSFWLALLNQVDATRAAMRSIRLVNPAARLIQTDDLGRTYSTAPISEQAEFDNLRRWAAWDLLFGRVDRHHPLTGVLDRMGLGCRARRIADDPCPPNVVGINHYLTSDRFLDHRIARYPAHLRGGNGRIPYADTEAVRVLDPPAGGLANALHEAWNRYGTQIAVTEVHNGCTIEERMRWAADAWDTAAAARRNGLDVLSVTAWSLLGNYGWDTLLTGDGAYEPGVYDLTSGVPEPTALAALWRGLPFGCERHPVARERGWWKRTDRLLYPPYTLQTPKAADPIPTPSPPVLLTRNPTSVQERVFVDACTMRGIQLTLAHFANISLVSSSGMPTAKDIWGVVAIDSRSSIRDGLDAGKSYSITISRSKPRSAFSRPRRTRLLAISIVAPDGDFVSQRAIGQLIDLIIEGKEGCWRISDPQGAPKKVTSSAEEREHCP